MEPSLFEAIIAKISKDYAYLGGIPVYIYNWGEPFLHPNYVELMHILAKYPNIYCMTSTNAGYVPELDEISAKMIRRVRLSMSGFSQESYDHIHKLPFDKVVRNIEYLVETFDKYDAKCDDFYIAFFEYPFTHPGYEDEVHKAREFTERLGLGLSVEKPGINDLRSYLDFYLGRMSEDRREFYNKYLNLDYAAYAKKAKSMRSRLKKSGSLKPPVVKAFDAANNCLTGHRVSINQRGELLPCCFVPYDDPQLVLGLNCRPIRWRKSYKERSLFAANVWRLTRFHSRYQVNKKFYATHFDLHSRFARCGTHAFPG